VQLPEESAQTPLASDASFVSPTLLTTNIESGDEAEAPKLAASSLVLAGCSITLPLKKVLIIFAKNPNSLVCETISTAGLLCKLTKDDLTSDFSRLPVEDFGELTVPKEIETISSKLRIAKIEKPSFL